MATEHHREHPEHHNGRAERYIRWAIVIFGIVLAALVVFFFVSYHTLRAGEDVSLREVRWSQALARHTPLPVSDASVIRSWMTFDYVNRLFALPPDYLAAQLQMTDPRYPRLTIATWAKSQDLTAAAVIVEINTMVRGYSGPQTTATSSAPR